MRKTHSKLNKIKLALYEAELVAGEYDMPKKMPESMKQYGQDKAKMMRRLNKVASEPRTLK